MSRRGFRLPQHRRRHDSGRAAARQHHHRGRAAARRGRGLRRAHRGHRPGVRARGGRAGGRPDQDLQPHLPLDRGGAGRELPEAPALDRQGRPGHHHQAGRPAPQHADAGAPAAGASGPGSPSRPGRSTRRWPTGSAWRASRRSWRTWRSSSWSRRSTATSPRQVAAKRAAREQTILQAARPRSSRSCSGRASTGFEVTGRPKHLWSIYQKMKKRDKAFDEIYDLMAVRVIVRSVPDCYHVLGIIHHNWTPLQERIKDYIASPKSNGVPVAPHHDLRTQAASSTRSRSAPTRCTAPPSTASRPTGSTRRERAAGRARPASRLVPPAARAAAGHAQPRGVPRVPEDRPLSGRDLRLHAAGRREAAARRAPPPIDFAFHVHTEVGLQCQGAKINGRIAPLHRELKNGDTVEILTSAAAKPSRDWLQPRPHRRAPGRRSSSGSITRRRRSAGAWARRSWPGRSGAGASILLTTTAWTRPPYALSLADGPGLEIAVGRGDVPIGQVMRALYPDLARRRAAGAQAHGLRPGDRPDPAGSGDQDPGRGRAHGPVRPVLPAGAGRLRGGIRHPGARASRFTVPIAPTC